jgi:hypothetical protein
MRRDISECPFSFLIFFLIYSRLLSRKNGYDMTEIKYEIEYVELENKRNPFEDFVLQLSIKERAKELRALYNKRFEV